MVASFFDVFTCWLGKKQESSLDTLIFSFSFSALCVVAFFSAKLLDRRILGVFALVTAAYLGLDDLVTGFASAYRGIDFIGGNWNWTGKILSLGLSALMIYVFKLSFETIGLTFKQNNIKIGLIALSLFIVWSRSE